MSEVRVRENAENQKGQSASYGSAATSFLASSEVRKREHYDKPSVRRKKKAEAARRKNAKK